MDDKVSITSAGLVDKVDLTVDALATRLIYKNANRVLAEVKSSLETQKGGKLANGELMKSLGVSKIENSKGSMVVRVGSGAAHAIFVEKGRRPGKQPPMRAVLDWVDTGSTQIPAGMTKATYARAVAKKIGSVGIEPLNFFEKALDKIKSSGRG